ncbi:traB domain-containing protein-like [Camellia sinensis]|uniref:traB domain-containing protein-like n=1 Tax=Camellia sinensis TaxID=4442 RepID=UPI0010357278|nr:traB domain-containing protein-like [Camellia sinensis]
MNRSTLALILVNSPESRLFITHLRLNPTVRSLAGVSTTTKPSRRQFSIANNNKRTASFAAGRRKPNLLSTAMDAPPPAGDDFVSIDGPESPVRQDPSLVDIENLVQSISSVDEDRGEDVDADVGDGGDQRPVLPEELSRSVMTLSCESSAEGGICDVYLVGTAHVSQESCQEVQAVISFLKPQAVFLELCSSRVPVLTLQNLKVPTMAEMLDLWKKQHNIFGILYSWFLAKVASKLEVLPGSEFRVAFEEASKYGAKVILGDRPIQITLRRTWAKMPLWHKTKLIYSLLFQALFLPSPEDLTKMLKEMDDVDMLTLVIQEMSKEFPTLMETLVHERDLYMSSTLLRVASEHSSVVAVIGKGHMQGIKKHWKQPVEVKHLLGVDLPSQKPAISAVKILATLGAAVAGVAIISGIYLSNKK